MTLKHAILLTPTYPPQNKSFAWRTTRQWTYPSGCQMKVELILYKTTTRCLKKEEVVTDQPRWLLPAHPHSKRRFIGRASASTTQTRTMSTEQPLLLSMPNSHSSPLAPIEVLCTSIQPAAIRLYRYYHTHWRYRRGHRKTRACTHKRMLSSRWRGRRMDMLSLWGTRHMDWLCGVCMVDCCVRQARWMMYLVVTGRLARENGVMRAQYRLTGSF